MKKLSFFICFLIILTGCRSTSSGGYAVIDWAKTILAFKMVYRQIKVQGILPKGWREIKRTLKTQGPFKSYYK